MTKTIKSHTVGPPKAWLIGYGQTLRQVKIENKIYHIPKFQDKFEKKIKMKKINKITEVLWWTYDHQGCYQTPRVVALSMHVFFSSIAVISCVAVTVWRRAKTFLAYAAYTSIHHIRSNQCSDWTPLKNAL